MITEIITGYVSSRRVFIGTLGNERVVEITPANSLMVVNHSPDGFMWGYAGSGPSQLALAILLNFTRVEIAKKLYQKFKFDVIAGLDKDKDFQILKRDMLEWLDNNAEE